MEEVVNQAQPIVRCYKSFTELPLSGYSLLQDAEIACFDLSKDWFRLLVDTALLESQSARIYAQEKNGIACVIFPLLVSVRV